MIGPKIFYIHVKACIKYIDIAQNLTTQWVKMCKRSISQNRTKIAHMSCAFLAMFQ